MSIERRRLLIPALFAAGSFLCLLLTALLTTPIQNVIYVAIFFISLFVLLLSLGYLLVYFRRGSVSTRSRYRIFIFSVFLMVLVMFRSSQSLSVIDILILVLITLGMVFYSSRRTYQ